jgi:hypothetical protein
MATDENLDAIQDGQHARLIRGSTEDFIIEREEQLLNALCMAYHANQLDHDMMVGAIGEIAGLRRFREQLESKIRRGTAAAEVELGNDG